MRPFSLYIHVPFCAHKCPYCDFNTYAVPEPPSRRYVDALIRELESYAEKPGWTGRPVRSVFFGGGTPSFLPPNELARVLDAVFGRFEREHSAIEVTLEANPDDADRLAALRSVGFNRVSFGTQTFSGDALKLLGRAHGESESLDAVPRAREAGFDNVSVDLMFGLPSQTREAFRQDLETAIRIRPDHISAYALTIEQGTPFFQSRAKGHLKLPSDDSTGLMLTDDLELLTQHGYRRYELSNFARPGKESVHNSGYWTGIDYLGLGAGAHSFEQDPPSPHILRARRWANLARPEAYMEAVESDSPATSWREELGIKELMVEFFLLGLRLLDGVDLGAFRSRFGRAATEVFPGTIEQMIGEKFLEARGHSVAVTSYGLPVLDSITEQFADPRIG